MDVCCEATIKHFQKLLLLKKYRYKDIFPIPRKKNKLETEKKKKKKFLKFWKFYIIFFSTNPVGTIKKIEKKMNFYFIARNQNKEHGNPLGNLPYFKFLFTNMIQNEKKYLPRANYMKYQNDINTKMRTSLIDWLIDVHLKFKLTPKTLFLSVNILDRFLSSKKIIRQKLQLLGVTTLLIASKYEEIYAPETRDFVYISDNIYSQDDIFKMESLICTALKFEFSYPSILAFLAHFLKHLHPQKEIIFMSNYFMELTLFDISILQYSFSLVAAATVICAKKIVDHLPKQLHFFLDQLGMGKGKEKKETREKCISLIKSLVILAQNQKQKIGAIKRKYATKKFGEVSDSRFAIRFWIKDR